MSSTDLSITSTDIQLALSPAILESMVGLSQEVIEPIAQVTFYLSWPWGALGCSSHPPLLPDSLLAAVRVCSAAVRSAAQVGCAADGVHRL